MPFLALGTVAFVVTGLPLALSAETLFQQVGLVIPVLLWPLFAVAGWRAIRRRDVTAHRAWMTRLYAVTFFAVAARMIVPLLLLVQLPWILTVYGGDVERVVERSVPVGQWLGWIVDLAIAEWLIRRRVRSRADGDDRRGSRVESAQGVGEEPAGRAHATRGGSASVDVQEDA